MVPVLLTSLEEVSAGGTGPGTEQVLSKHLTEPSGSDETGRRIEKTPTRLERFHSSKAGCRFSDRVRQENKY